MSDSMYTVQEQLSGVLYNIVFNLIGRLFCRDPNLSYVNGRQKYFRKEIRLSS